jgi:hypothetical protein
LRLNLLLVSKHEAGVQTFFKDQHFRISRLTPIRAGSNFIESCAEEIRNTDVSGRPERHARGRPPDRRRADQDDSMGTLSAAVLRGRCCMQTAGQPSDIVAKAGVNRAALDASGTRYCACSDNEVARVQSAPPADQRIRAPPDEPRILTAARVSLWWPLPGAPFLTRPRL